MRPEGVISVYGSALDMNPSLPFGQFLFKALKIDIALIYILNETDRQNAIDSLHKALIAGDLLPQIDQIYPLEDCASAHQHVERGGRRGAVLLEIK
jgi:NADPH2:quinone reductase